MSYALKILNDEKFRIEQALSEWDLNKYPEARKERKKRLEDIDNIINLIKKDLLSLKR